MILNKHVRWHKKFKGFYVLIMFTDQGERELARLRFNEPTRTWKVSLVNFGASGEESFHANGFFRFKWFEFRKAQKWVHTRLKVTRK